MFYAKQDGKAIDQASFAIRMRNAGAGYAQTAAQGVGTACQSAATGVSNGMRQGVYGVRVWAAPRLESAADYTTATFAPKVSAALRSSAQQVRPVDLRQKKSYSALTWSLLAAAVLAAAGAAAAVAKYRTRATTTVDEEFPAASPGMAGGAPAQDASGVPADTGADGRVSTSG